MEKLVISWSTNNFIFYGKLIIIALYCTGFLRNMGNIDLPLGFYFESNPDDYTDFYIWQLLFLTSSVFLFFNKHAKLCMLVNGLLLVLALAMNPTNFSHNIFFCACLLIVFSASNKSFNYVPIQLAIVYFGAFLDKLVFEQWRNGDFMTAFFRDNSNSYKNFLTSLMGETSLSITLTYSTLIIEFVLVVLVLIPKTRKIFILLGLTFHFISTIIMNYFFSMFIIAIVISYFSLLKTSIDFNNPPNLARLGSDIKTMYNSHKSNNQNWFSYKLNGYTYRNYYAVVLYILLNPFTIILMTILLSIGTLFLKQIIFLSIILLFLGVELLYKRHKNKLQTENNEN